jgi:hypothetical protein
VRLSSLCIWREDRNLEENWEGRMGAEGPLSDHPKWNMISFSKWRGSSWEQLTRI